MDKFELAYNKVKDRVDSKLEEDRKDYETRDRKNRAFYEEWKKGGQYVNLMASCKEHLDYGDTSFATLASRCFCIDNIDLSRILVKLFIEEMGFYGIEERIDWFFIYFKSPEKIAIEEKFFKDSFNIFPISDINTNSTKEDGHNG